MPELVLVDGSEAPLRVDLPMGTTLLAAIRRAGAPLGRACRGEGVCRSCSVRVAEGEDALNEPTPAEQAWALPARWRLACQARARDGREVAIEVWSPTWGADPETAHT